MINNINPLHITRITWKPFHREGSHPYALKLMRRKGWLGSAKAWILGYHPDECDYVDPAQVIIHGQSGVIVRINCRTNQAAMDLCNEYNRQLADYINEIAVLDRLYRVI